MKVLITGAYGQDARCLVNVLSNYKDMELYVTDRRRSQQNPPTEVPKATFVSMDLTDTYSIIRVLNEVEPDCIYHLAAQSHVGWSYKIPETTMLTNTMSVLTILEWIRGASPSTRLYFAATSEMFSGDPNTAPQNENTPKDPQSPYGVSKLAAFNLVKIYREAYNLKVASGILFNHEGRLRGDEFITKKICNYVKKLDIGKGDFPPLLIGNPDTSRDFGFAPNFCKAMYMIANQDLYRAKPFRYDINIVFKDYVIATGVNTTIKDFALKAFHYKKIYPKWVGSGLDTKCVLDDGRVLIKCSPEFYRPTEVKHLLGDASLAKEELGWIPSEDSVALIIKDMMEN